MNQPERTDRLVRHRRRVVELCAECGESWPCVISQARDEIVGMFRRAADGHRILPEMVHGSMRRPPTCVNCKAPLTPDGMDHV